MAVQFISKAALTKSAPKIPMPQDLRLQEMLRPVGQKDNGHLIYEFVGTDNFGTEWNERRRFEVDAGRDEEPLLYQPIYDEVRDSSLPQNISIHRIGPGGVVLEEVYEGGEVKFASVTSSDVVAKMRHYGVGLEYSKDLVVYNELWSVPIVERQAGIAYNALLNHIHLSPILDATYTSANQTSGNTSGTTLIEDYMLTLEDAIVAGKTDQVNPRRGPYTLLISTADMFMVEKALTRVPQQGVSIQSSAIGMINNVIAYDGWTGTRGNLSTTYPGVTPGTGYLISQQYRGQDFMSFIKQDFMQHGVEEDISRFMTQVVWDTYFTNFADPLRAVEEISWPTPG